jgi:hypothetical protein
VLVASLAVLLLTAGGPAAFAQSFTGQIVGSVADQTGAVLPGVTITATNVDTNATREILTNETGNYTITALPAGNYRIEAQFPGFATQVRTGVVLQVNQAARIDFEMAVGDVAQTIDVIGTAPLVETDTASLGQVIDRDKIDDLPLNGRSFLGLNMLATGVSELAQGENTASRGGNAHINGGRLWGNNFILDGVDNNDLANGEIRLLPSIDALAEFKIQTSTFAAEFGRATGGVVNLTTKTGTNEFHGTLFGFHRNDNLDATNFFVNRANREKPEFKRSDFGGTIGGPIVSDHTFFFFNYEGSRQSTNANRSGLVPTRAMRQGDFSATGKTIIDPTTGQPFAGNIIPSSRFSPRAQAFLPFFSDPDIDSVTGANNTFRSTGVPKDIDQYTIRVDTKLTENQTFFGRYTHSDDVSVRELQRTTTPGLGDDVIKNPQAIALFLTSIWSNQLVGETKFGFSRSNTQILQRKEAREGFHAKALGLTETQSFASDNDLIQKFPGLSISGYDQPQGNGGGFARFHNNWHVSEALTWTRGDHTFKFGGEFRREGMNLIFPSNTSGSYTFNQAFTGDNFADFLLGYLGSAGRKVGNSVEHERGNFFSYFFQDDWKATPNLTINWGLRHDVQLPLYEQDNLWRQWNFDTGQLVQLGVDIGTNGAWDTDKNNFAPRLGFAWDVTGDGNTVIRAGGGIFYDVLLHNYPFQMFLGPPSSSVENNNAQAFNDVPFDNPFPNPPATITVGSNTRIRTVVRDSANTYMQRWSLSIQRALHNNVLLDLAYVGSKGLRDRIGYDGNQPLLVGDPTKTAAEIAATKPYPQVGRISTGSTEGQSTYHSFQAKLEQRTTNGLSYIASYTWSKNIGTGGASAFGNPGSPQDALNRIGAEKGLISFDRKHRFSFNYIYEFPASGLEGAASRIVDGWQLTGIVTAMTGTPLTVTSSRRLPGSIGGQSFRPDRVCNPNISNGTPDRWFDTNCFAAPGNRFGNASRGTVRAPGRNTWDLSLIKNTYIGEDQNLQLRFEFFNAFNRTNFQAPNVTFVPGAAGTTGSTTGSFGTINAANDARQIQVGLKFFF